jgi:hypothetical protein
MAANRDASEVILPGICAREEIIVQHARSDASRMAGRRTQSIKDCLVNPKSQDRIFSRKLGRAFEFSTAVG